MKTTFSVTYAIITPESAEYGDVDDSGMIESGLNLRDAVSELFRTRTNEVDSVSAIEPSCYPLPESGWLEFSPAITVYNGMEYRTGENENRSLFPNGRITASSWKRICNLISKGA